MRRTPRRWRIGLGIAALALVTPLVTAATVTSPSSASASAVPNAAPTVNWALASTATATATTAESGDPASNAIDGDAGTDWCTGGWTGTLTVDLGQARTLNDLGITLDAASPSASASIELASTAGAWQQPPELRDLALDPGSPMYFPLPHGTSARYAEITVFSDTGADVCVGEFRTYGPDQAAAGMDLGADLSFTPQELAAGATFTDQGRPGTPVTIMREAGANYVRMRLWVDPPAGYSDLASDLALARQQREHGAGEPGPLERVVKGECASRRLLGRLQADTVAGGERSGRHAGRDREREVPRRDDGGHSARAVVKRVVLTGNL